MRGIDELDHYELLEIAPGVTQAAIDRAYRTAQSTYADGSLALYSVFENVDAAAIRERFDEAYRVLSDSELRAQYDYELSIDEKISEKTLAAAGRYDPASREPFVHGSAGAEVSQGMSSYGPIDSVEDAVEEFDAIEDDGRGEFDGVRLRRNRLFRGYEIEQISDVTKVSSAHLRNIEAENFGDLPADVYVRGFVTAYAQTIGLDPKIVVPSYMARVEQSRGNPQRGSFLARR